jgi:hypothetical protein
MVALQTLRKAMSEPADPSRLKRRLLLLKLGAAGAVAGPVLPAVAQGSKGGRGTGITDSDPNDGAGNGRGLDQQRRQPGQIGAGKLGGNQGEARGQGHDYNLISTAIDPPPTPREGRPNAWLAISCERWFD